MLSALAGWWQNLAQSLLCLSRMGVAECGCEFGCTRVHHELELNVVGIAEDHSGSETNVDDSRVRNALLIEMRDPSVQFVPIPNLKTQVIKADAPFIECTVRRFVVGGERHHETRGVDKGHGLEGFPAGVVQQMEAHHVLPPGRRRLAIQDRQIDVGEPP